MEERIKDAKPMMDLMAKKVFSNTEITAQFIRDILDLPVQTVTILDGTQIHEQQFEDFLTYMTSIDVLAALQDGTQVIIEIQVAFQIDFIKRLWLYLCEQVSRNLDVYKKDGAQTHRLAEEMLPVYTIAITQKRFFDDERMIHSFSLRDDTTSEELKVHFKGINEKRNLVRMVFLELEKYHNTDIQQYRKVRWIEFFGNKPYTQNPEAILKQADQIINPVGWTKEEKAMLDERTRYLQAYYGHLATVEYQKEEALRQGLQQGLEQGLEQGLQQGRIETIVDLIKNGILSKEVGAEQLNISEKELNMYL